eukprot:7377031-Prymnesium_polylepis.1
MAGRVARADRLPVHGTGSQAALLRAHGCRAAQMNDYDDKIRAERRKCVHVRVFVICYRWAEGRKVERDPERRARGVRWVETGLAGPVSSPLRPRRTQINSATGEARRIMMVCYHARPARVDPLRLPHGRLLTRTQRRYFEGRVTAEPFLETYLKRPNPKNLF